MPQFNSLFQYSGKYFSAYKSYPVDKASFDQFLQNLKKYLAEINQLGSTANEEALKKCLSDFLTSAFKYKTQVGYRGQNSKGGSSIDLVTVEDNEVRAIFETKNLGKTTELFSLTANGLDINKKALHESIYYFYAHIDDDLKRQRISHVVLTDMLHFIFVDPKSFVHKGLKKICDDFMEGRLILNSTSDLYDSDLKPFIEKNHIDFDFAEFDLNKFQNKFETNASLTESDLRDLRHFYKLLHPNFLHKEFKPRDANKLNEKFYQELLFIFGLEEKTVEGKRLIVPIDDKSSIYHQITKRQEKENRDEAISLISIWMNRILFLKLFETQLFEFNGKKKEFNFFSSSKVRDCSDLSALFFHVLNTPIDDRILQNKHDLIPYLNSSLFEKKPLENILTIAEVLNEPKKVYDKTSLKSKKGKTLTFVQYLLDFLDAYSFNETDEETDKETGEIISSSVLGLVFEKLNGYKDGSFFTPASITEFITKEVIDRVVLDKFNALFNGKKAPAENIEELKNLLGYDAHKTERKELYTKTFNDIKILDPACGSGHFLVSALNYLIYLKSYLGLMSFSNRIEIHNDSLVVLDTDGTKVFSYQRNDESLARIQQQLFEEKANLIRNSLFGCDINSMSVEICRLRLWIELLKNAYYKSDFDMEVLPNIDINIKAGDSLSTSFWKRGNENLYATKEQLSDLQTLLNDYKAGRYKTSKHALLEEIRKNRVDLKNQLYFTDKLDNPIRWEIDFPEALNPKGGFEGFDIVLGNPPYIQLQADKGFLKDKYNGLNYLTFESSGDIYQLFYEQGWHLLKNSGYLCFITSNTWMRAAYGAKTRKLLSGNFKDSNSPIPVDLKLLLDLAGNKIFENATVDTNILIFKKSQKENGASTKCKTITDLKDLDNSVSSCFEISFAPDEPWTILSPIEQSIKRKIEAVGTPLKDWDINIYRGVLTGYNDAFIISTEKREEILANCQSEDERTRTAELIRPILRGRDIKRYGYEWDEKWLINTHNGIKEVLPRINVNEYPAIKAHLDQYWDKISKRADKGDTPYNLRNCAYLEDFSKQQIVWIELSDNPKFALAQNMVSVNTVFFLTGEHILHLLGLLNSKLITWYFHHCIGTTSGVGTNRWLKYTIEQIPMAKPNGEIERLVKEVSDNYDMELDKVLDQTICKSYYLDDEETAYIMEQ